MKIKQTTRIVVLAIALVAVIGVGAVSFAAWQGGAPTITANASVGHVNLVGFTGTMATDSQGSLVPVDQGTGNRILNIDLPAYAVSANYKVTVTYTLETGKTLGATTKFYAIVDKATETMAAPAKDSLTAEGSKWLEVTTTGDACAFNFEITTDGYVALDDLVLHVVLVSETNADMDISVSFTVALALAA